MTIELETNLDGRLCQSKAAALSLGYAAYVVIQSRAYGPNIHFYMCIDCDINNNNNNNNNNNQPCSFRASAKKMAPERDN